MTLQKDMAGLAVGLGATSLAVNAAKMAKDQLKCPGSKIRSNGRGRGLGTGKGKGPIGLVQGMTNLTLGTALLGPTAKLVNKL